MSSKKSPAGLAAEEACRKFPDTPSRTLARMLLKHRPKLFKSINHARDKIAYIRGNRGKTVLGQLADKSLVRKNRKAGETVKMPQSVPVEWEPVQIDGPCKVAILSDLHIPYHDMRAIRVAVKKCQEHKPKVLLINGDFLDFHHGSRFEHNPENRDIVGEIRDGVQMMRYLREQFPKARLIYKFGNHDERWQKYVWANAPVLWQLNHIRLPGVLGWEHSEQTGSDEVELASYGWECVDGGRPIMAGSLPILHGHELKASSPVNPARGAWLKMSDTVLIGHLHQASQHTQMTWSRKEIATWSTGCLCALHPEYARVNKWGHGFAVVEVSRNNEFDVHNYRISSEYKVRTS